MKLKSFGEILREKRKAKGWSQSKLAKKANTCTSVISGYERGRSIPNLYLACDLASAFGCDVEELVGKPNKARQLKEALMNFFSNDETLAMVEVDAEYINEQIGNIAKEMLEGKTSHFYHREAEKNLRLLNEAQGVAWHSVADELPSENGTYLVVGKSGKVCTAHFYKEHTLHGKTYSWHFSNRYVHFWAKLPEPPIPD